MINNIKYEILIDWVQYTYSLVIPSGNPTALVEREKNIVLTMKQKKKINDYIMAISPTIEQVGFIYKDIANPKLEMAWWEFCWNATRGAIFRYFIDYGVKINAIKVWWIQRKLRTNIEEIWGVYFSESEIPIYSSPNKIEKVNEQTYIVNMEWISHIVIEDSFPTDNIWKYKIKSRAKNVILEYQKNYKNLRKVLCIWVIYVKNIWNVKEIKPVIFVRSINTSFYETACWSWTCAVWLIEALRNNQNIDIDVRQPSGYVISSKVEYNWREFWKAYIRWVIR